jgi:septum formation protein
MTVKLASTSTIRRHLLLQAGVDVTAEPPRLDEVLAKAQFADLGPDELALELAMKKAVSLSGPADSTIVIGADQVLEQDGRRFDKPSTLSEARAQLIALRGRTHRLVSAVCCVRQNRKVWSHVASAQLDMRAFSDAFLDDYLQHMGSEAMQSVGAYKLESRGAQMFAAIRGDYFTILGLPLLPLLAFLRESGELMT